MHSVQSKYSSAWDVCCDCQWVRGHLSSLGLTSHLTSHSLRACLPTMCVCTYVWKSEVHLRWYSVGCCSHCFSETRSLLGLELTYSTGLAAYKAPGSQGAARVHLPVPWWQDCAMVLGIDLSAHPCSQAPSQLSSLSTHVSFLSNLILSNFPSKTYIPPHYCSCKRICVFRF